MSQKRYNIMIEIKKFSLRKVLDFYVLMRRLFRSSEKTQNF